MGNYAAGGTWFSYSKMGECQPGAAVGEDGCTWKAKGITKAINASCLYRNIDANIEEVGKTCFSACPADPTGMSTW